MLEIPNNQNKQVNVGYTRAVDMWAIGCVSVVLLTGGLAFFDPNTGSYSERLAKACDLDYLRKSTEWQCVRSRPKSFVESLLIRDEAQRMTAEQALSHEWFSNEIHDTDFHDLYQRCIKHWRPTIPKAPLVKFLDNSIVKNLGCSREYLCQINKKHPSRSRTNMPVDAPLKPFPMAMHKALQPQRGVKPAVSEEVSLAIKNTWKAKLTPSTVPRTKHKKVCEATSCLMTTINSETRSETKLPGTVTLPLAGKPFGQVKAGFTHSRPLLVIWVDHRKLPQEMTNRREALPIWRVFLDLLQERGARLPILTLPRTVITRVLRPFLRPSRELGKVLQHVEVSSLRHQFISHGESKGFSACPADCSSWQDSQRSITKTRVDVTSACYERVHSV